MADDPNPTKPPITPFESSEAPLRDDPTAKELFVDGYQGVLSAGGVARFNLFAMRLGADQETAERVIVARLAMPLPVVIQFHAAFGELLAGLERDGVIKRIEAPGDATKS